MGAIEGVADAALSASKAAGGLVADRPEVERKNVTAAGHTITAAGHGAFAVAPGWPFVAIFKDYVHNIAPWLAVGTDRADARVTASDATDAGAATWRPSVLAGD